MSLEFDFKKRTGSIIKVIGVGGGGGNAVASMFKKGIVGVDFAVCNTDNQALENSPVDMKIQLGPHLTEGRGAGSKPEIGKQACMESIDDVKRFLGDGTKMLFVTAGMGGGTGTGAGPIVAKAAKELGILTVAIVTLPFKFEGVKRQRYALEGLEEIKQSVDAYLIISNDRLGSMYGNLSLSEAFDMADNILFTAAKGIAEIITVPGHINVDFEDVNTVMRGSGVSIMGSGSAGGDDRARVAIEQAMNSPLLEENDIRGSQHILLNITSGKKEVTMSEVTEITDYVQEEAGYGTNIIWGNCRDESIGDKICVTLIATGFKTNQLGSSTIETEKIKVSLDEFSKLREDSVIAFGNEVGFDAQTVDFEEDDVRRTIETLNQDIRYHMPDKQLNREEEIHASTEKEKYQRIEKARREYLQRSLTQKLDDPRSLNDMISEPAFKRRNVVLEDTSELRSRADLSRFVIGEDEDNPLQKSNNSFLHENAD